MNARSSGKIRRSEAEWVKILSAYEQSGLSQEVFCEREGVAESSLSKWRRKLVQSRNGFIEVKPEASAWDIELELGGNVVLRLRGR